MKNLYLIPIISLFAFQLTSCKSEKKEENTKETSKQVSKTAPFSLKQAKNNINFTAYKTTDKVPVKGVFNKVELLNNFEGTTLKEAINGAEFKIPVSSIETNDSSRNYKIQKFFFSAMENTMSLTGTLTLTDEKTGIAKFTMNGITQDLPFDYTISGNTFSMKTIMNIDKWNGQKAIASLNEICKQLHKGADGVSKTWSEVAIEVTSTFN